MTDTTRRLRATARLAFAPALAAAALAAAGPAPVRAADLVRVGKAVPNVFAFTPIDVAVDIGAMQRNGIDVKIFSFQGGSKLHQGLVANAVDIGLGSGPEIAIALRGHYAMGVAALANPPLSLGFTVWHNSPIKTLDDLKGKRIGVGSVGSLTYWLALELARVKGWGPHGVTTVALGGGQGQYAGLKTHAIDATLESAAIGWQLEKKGEARMVSTIDYVKDFHTHVIWASTKMIAERPDVIRRFLKAWFETIAWIRANRDKAIPLIRKVTRYDQDVEAREYDAVTPFFSTDGRFHEAALKTLERSFVELGLTKTAPDVHKVLTEQFLPKM